MSVQTVSGNVQLLHSTGQDWMTPPVTAAFATSGLSGPPLVAAAEQARQTLKASSFDGWDSLLHDPVLQKQDSTALALSRWFNNVIGPWPIAQPDLVTAQRSLQQDGYGASLPTDGAWTPEWNAAYVAAARDHYQAQLAGNRPGSVPPQKLLNSLVHRMMGAGMVDTIAGVFKSIPGEVRNAASYLGGHAEQDFSSLVHGHFGEFLHSSQPAQMQAAHREATIARALGSNVTDAQQHAQEFGNAVSALGTIFTLAGAGAAARGIKAATSETLARSTGLFSDLGAQEAARGPGVIARTVSSAFSPERAYANMPILRTVGPQVGKLADESGLYYRARTLLAQPYRLPAVQIAGNVVGRASLFSAGATGAAEAADIATPGNSPLHPILATTTPLDAVDDAIRAKTHGIISLDDLNLLLHAPLTGTGALSARVGNSVEGARAAVDEGLGNVGFVGALQRATGLDYPQIVAKWGGADRFQTWARYKLAQMAANFHAEDTLRRLNETPNPERIAALRNEAGIGVDKELLGHGYTLTPEDIATHGKLPAPYSRDWHQIAQQLTHEAWAKPDLLAQRAQDMAANPHYTDWQLRSEIAQHGGTVDKWHRQGVADFMDAAEHYRANLLEPFGQHLLTPSTFAAMRAEKTMNAVAAAPAGTPAVGSEQWLAAYHAAEHRPGSFGLARNDRLTVQGADQVANDLDRQVQAAGDDLDARNRVAIRAGQVLQDEFSMDGHRLAALNADTPEKLIQVIRDHGRLLASDVYLAHNAPAEAAQALQQLGAKGYKPVYGTDVGHLYDGSYPQATPVDGPITAERRFAEALGLSPERFASTDVSHIIRANAESRIQKLIDDPTFHGIPTFTSSRDYLTYTERVLEDQGLPWGRRVAFNASPFNTALARQRAEQMGTTPAQARELLQKEAARQLNVRDYPVKKLRDALTNVRAVDGEGKPLVSWLAHVGTDEIPGLSDRDANRLAMALYGAYRPPAYMGGADVVGALLRQPLAIGGKPFGLLPPTNAMTRLATLNNAMIARRNDLRFALSPMFSFRRVAKTNVKLGIAGVQTTWNPSGWLLRRGVYDEAHRYLDTLFPEQARFHSYAEESLRALRQQDLFGIYNPTEYEAYAAHYAKTVLGKSDPEVRSLINTSFNYGSMTAEGRTAAERTVNMVFFPFSFEKTLYRNVGAFLLDHPGQSLLLNQALQLYGHLNSNKAVTDWVDAHAPLLKEFQHLNAFAYGVSPGELGGINAPLLNLLSPQAWAVNNATAKNLGRLAPVLTDFQRVAKEGAQQLVVLDQGTRNAWDVAQRYATSNPRSPLEPRAAAETPDAQFTDALRWRLQLISAFQKVIDYNGTQGSDATKYSWPTQSWVPPTLRGRPINKTTIGTLVHERFPKYNPLDATFFAVKRQEAIDQFVAKHAGTPYGSDLASWVAAARSVIGYLNSDSYTAPQQADAQGQIRQYAVRFAEQDPAFLKWYGKNFRSHFGPIDTLR